MENYSVKEKANDHMISKLYTYLYYLSNKSVNKIVVDNFEVNNKEHLCVLTQLKHVADIKNLTMVIKTSLKDLKFLKKKDKLFKDVKYKPFISSEEVSFNIKKIIEAYEPYIKEYKKLLIENDIIGKDEDFSWKTIYEDYYE